MEKSKAARTVVATVFIALVSDLLAFTLPSPLFPRSIAWYLQKEVDQPSAILPRLLSLTNSWRSFLLSKSGTASGRQLSASTKDTKNWDVVLLGGAMGSLFSFCQCVISPKSGSLSDRYGRKKVSSATMLGNILSAVIWLKSTGFSTFLLSRLVGGLSEGNVQLSTAIISDVTTPATRSKSLASVGIAFSICFTLGPSLGAYFASRPLPIAKSGTDHWNVYATPAAISSGLLLLETSYLIVKSPETRHWRSQGSENKEVQDKEGVVVKDSSKSRSDRLRKTGRYHCAFLLFFSGAEFTLTFLTYDSFGATNAQNGRLLSYIGVSAALLQARYIRPALARKGELQVAYTGSVVATCSFFLLAASPSGWVRDSDVVSTIVLYAAATGLAYVSATVVTGLTAAAAACCDEEGEGSDQSLRRGRALGGFRSMGQLGRAIGPLLASSVYWSLGPLVCYSAIASCLSMVGSQLRGYLAREAKRRDKARKIQ